MNVNSNNIIYSSPVDKSQAGQRIDKFLREDLPDISRSQLQRLITSGNVFLDDSEITDKDYRIKEQDSFVLFIPPAVDAIPQAENIALNVVYEDDDLIVVNKPSGMTVHPAPGAYNGTLVNALLYHCRDNLSGIGGVKRPGIVHRIDKETSGLLVVAKNDHTHKGLCEQFMEHSIERTYYAIVYGLPNPSKGTIVGNIARSRFDRKKMALVQTGGKHAVTHYETIKNNGEAVSLVKCNLETGRTHQIRVHLSSIGCNLIGDKTYTKSGKNQIKGFDNTTKVYINEFPRQALHAATLGFIHPGKSIFMQFNSELPEDIMNLRDCLFLS